MVAITPTSIHAQHSSCLCSICERVCLLNDRRRSQLLHGQKADRKLKSWLHLRLTGPVQTGQIITCDFQASKRTIVKSLQSVLLRSCQCNNSQLHRTHHQNSRSRHSTTFRPAPPRFSCRKQLPFKQFGDTPDRLTAFLHPQYSPLRLANSIT